MADELILIVDDDRNLRKLIENYVRSGGYRTVQADSGETAIQTLKTENPDLILLDIQMQGMDGFQTLKSIRNERKFLNTPILFLTSAAHTEVKVKGLESDADDYILKSTPKEEVLARIKAALRRTERFRQTGQEGVMSGHLSDMGPAELLQHLESTAKTASVNLPEMDADIYVEQGDLVYVRKGDFTGEEALARILFLEEGHYMAQFNKLPTDIPKQPIPLTSILMKVLAVVDEVRDHIKRLDLAKVTVDIDYHLCELGEFEEFRELSPVNLIDLLVMMRGNLKQNLKAIVVGVKEKELHLVRR